MHDTLARPNAGKAGNRHDTTHNSPGAVMIRPYTLNVPKARLDWIASRVADAHIGYAPDDDADWKYGTSARYLAQLRDGRP